MKKTITTVLALILLALPVLAQDGGGKGEEEYDVEAAMRKVAELLKKAEGLLVETLKPRDGASAEAVEAGQAARKALEDLLREGRESGEEAAKKMTEILENAPQGSGKGQGDEREKQKPEDDQARKDREKELGKHDPQNSEKSGQPENPREEKGTSKDDTKPPAKPGDASKPNPEDDWLAKLPPQIRQDYLNKDWGRIPPKWRAFIDAYVKKLAETEGREGGD